MGFEEVFPVILTAVSTVALACMIVAIFGERV